METSLPDTRLIPTAYRLPLVKLTGEGPENGKSTAREGHENDE